MYEPRKSLVAAAGLLALVGVATLFTPDTVRSQEGPIGPVKPVLVVNSPSEPVPVTGTVGVSNLGDSPLPVRDVDNPARQPFQGYVGAPPVGIPDPNPFFVPEGKRLVIEYVSAETRAINAGCVTAPRYALRTTAGGVTLDHFFYSEDTGTLIASPGFPARAYGLSRQTRIYADPDTQLTLSVRTGSDPSCSYLNDGTTGLHVSGYLVDVP